MGADEPHTTMPRTYISTLGFHETRVTRPILQRQLEDEDRVILVRPPADHDDGRGADAVDYVRDMLTEIAEGATVSVKQVDPDPFVDAVQSCAGLIAEAEGTVIVNLGGGAREVFLPLSIATILHADRVDTALQYTDIDQEVREWPVPNLRASISDAAWATLETLATEETASIPELTDLTGKSKSTVTRHVDELDRADAVDTTREGKTKHVTLAPTGRLLLNSKSEQGT